MSKRLEYLFDLQAGTLLFSFLRRKDEGRALAAIGTRHMDMVKQVKSYEWPMSYICRIVNENQRYQKLRLGMASNGTIIACDVFHSKISVFRKDGTIVCEWGGRGDRPGKFSYPECIFVSPNDEVFVGDCDSVQVFLLDGTFLRKWGKHGSTPGHIQYSKGITVHRDYVFISDMNNRVQCFLSDGTFVWESRCNLSLRHPKGMAVSKDGELFVCSSDHSIYVLDIFGAFKRSFGSKGNEPGQFIFPQFVAISANNEVFISDNMRVQVFLTDGTFIRTMNLGTFNPLSVVATRLEIVIYDLNNNRIYIEPNGA